MILASFCPVLVRISLIAFLVIALTHVCIGQQVEQQQVLFDDDLQQINLTPPLEQSLHLDILNQQGATRWYSMFTQLPNDWSRTMGISLKAESVPAIASIGVLTFSLMRTDNQTWKSTRRLYRTSATFNKLSNYTVALGDGRFHLGIATAFAGYGWLWDDPKALRVASQTVEAFLATGITVQLLKRVTGRECPAAATTHQTGRWKFFPHPQQYDKHPPSYYAFPSGHISTTMATLTVIAENYPQERWIKPVGYTLIGALGVSLVAKGMHWYSDLPVGIALGYLFGKIAANPSIPDLVRGAKEKGLDISVTPLIDGQGVEVFTLLWRSDFIPKETAPEVANSGAVRFWAQQ
jgi:membrane-associated phospholipid phosphatase